MKGKNYPDLLRSSSISLLESNSLVFQKNRITSKERRVKGKQYTSYREWLEGSAARNYYREVRYPGEYYREVL